MLHVIFDDGRDCLYDVGEDIENIKGYEDLKIIHGLFKQELSFIIRHFKCI